MRAIRGFLKDIFFAMHRVALGSRASVLSYHNIGADTAFFTVTPRGLERQLRYLKARGFTVVLLSELLLRLREGKGIGNHVSLTFNDGYKSFYTELFPLLKRYEVPATIFLCVEFLDTSIRTSDGHTFKTLAVSDIRDMLATGLVEFMPEGEHRVALDSVPPERAVEQIDMARKNIESLTRKEAPVFAYSKGEPTEQITEHLRAHGWLGAVTSGEGLVHADSDPFSLPRNAINSRTSWTQFKGKVSGAIERYVEYRA